MPVKSKICHVLPNCDTQKLPYLKKKNMGAPGYKQIS